MSLYRLATEEVEVATRKKPEVIAKGGAVSQAKADDAFDGLTKYIPTESLTLYVAAVSSQKALIEIMPWFTSEVAYIIFLVMTPILMLVLFLRKFAIEGKEWKLSVKSWPWWSIVASTIAFAVWALAVPGNAIIDTESQAAGVVAGFGALVVSTVLKIFEPFFK